MRHFRPEHSGSWDRSTPHTGEVVQVAALCLRETTQGPEVLLITSLRTRRWILPKGWPMSGRSLAESALEEAWEEAGVTGRLHPVSIGTYRYRKQRGRGRHLLCRVEVFCIEVEALACDYPERGRRQRMWMSPAVAASAVDEPDLKALLHGV